MKLRARAWRGLIAAVVAVPIALTGACDREAVTADDRTALQQGVREYLSNLRWSDMRFSGRCGDHFQIGDVEITDLRAQDEAGAMSVVASITATNPPRYTEFPWGWCFGVNNQNSSARIRLEMNIERWDSGWRLASQQRRLSPF